jgi:O-antigen ligase
MRELPSAADLASRRAVSMQPPSGRGLALVVGPLVGLLVAQVVDREGPGPLAAAIGVVIAGAALLAVARRLHLALLPVTLVLPLAGYLTILWPEQGFSAVFDLVVLGPFLLLFLRKLGRPDAIRLLDRRWWPVWGFLLVVLLQVLISEGVSWLVTLQGFRRNVLPMLLFFVAVNVDLSRPALLRRMAWLSMAVAVVVAAWGLKQRFLGLDAAEQLHAASVGTLWLAGSGTDLRIFSTLRVPWALGVYCAVMSLISITVALAARTWIARVLAWGVALLLGSTLVFTLMRGAMAGYLLGVLVFAASGLGRRGRRAALRTAALLLGVAALVVAAALSVSSVLGESDNVVVQRFLTLTRPLSEEAMIERFLAWKSAREIIVNHPLGLGLGTTSGVSARYEQLIATAPIHTDNLYLGTFVETGWLGGAMLLVLTVWIFVQGRHALHRDQPGDAWLAVGILAGLLASTTASLATPVVWEPGTSQLYWLMAGVVVNLAARCPCRRGRGRIPATGRWLAEPG